MLGPLHRPDSYFERRAPGLNLGRAAAVALLVALVATATVGVFGYALAERAGGRPSPSTTRTDRPTGSARTSRSVPPPRSGRAVTNRRVARWRRVRSSGTPSRGNSWSCSSPRWPAGSAAASPCILTALAGGEGSFGDSLTVAGWAQVATIPQFLLLVVAFVTFAGTFDFTAGEAALRAQVASFRSDLRHPVLLLGTALTTVWQGYVYYHGMYHARNVGRDAAVGIAVVCGLLAFPGTVS